EAFFAIKGNNRDGHDFVAAALAAGAGLAVVAADRRESFPKDAPLLIVADVLEGLRDLARAARARSRAKIIGVTGSVGQTGPKGGLPADAARQRRDPCLACVLKPPLGGPAVAGALSRERTLRGVRAGHEPCRRDRATRAVGAAAGRDHHHDRAGASRILRLAR